MEERQIIKNLKKFQGLTPEDSWKTGLKTQLFGDSQENVLSRGFLPFNFHPAPALIPIAAAFIVVIVAFFGFVPVEEPVIEEDYFVLLETKLNEVDSAEDFENIVSMINQASESISDRAAEDPKETARTVVSINKKVEEIEKDFGEQAKDLKDSAQILTAKTAEVLEKDIENTQKELAQGLISGYESVSLSNPQSDLLEKAKEYYNNQQFEMALETIFRIGQ